MSARDPAARAAARRRYEERHPGRRTTTKHSARTDRRVKHLVHFVGVDGEGVDRPDGAHDYNLLSVGGRSLHHPDGRRLTTVEIFEFLWESQVPGAAHVGFFLGYDFAQWLKDLPEERARMLLTPQGQASRRRKGSHGNPTPFPVRWGEWEFDVLPNMKRFKLRPLAANDGDDAQPWLYVCDAGPLYQTSLLRAIDPETWPEPVCSEAEYETIKAGKQARSSNLREYGAPVDRETTAYNVLENDVLARLMARTNLGLVAMGVRLDRNQWHGPGQAAQAWLKSTARGHSGEECRLNAPVEPDGGPHDAARCSYFGGWFEIMVHGPVPGVTWEYDVNSAYPHIIADLPCLLHGKWEHHRYGDWARPSWASDVLEVPNVYRLVEAEVRGLNPFIGAMLHRTPKGAVCRPQRTVGWYWAHELVAACDAGLVDSVSIRQTWTYHPCDCPPPFRSIRELYEHRLAVGKQTPQGRAMRLVYNSAYGKIAQSVGAPLFGNSVYASLITAGCRTAITEAIGSHPDGPAAVVMVATDGVYFSSPHPGLDIDPQRLGAWDEATKTNLSLFKPGVYWDDKSREALREGGRLGLKSRGINEAALGRVLEEIDRQWETFEPGPDPSVWPQVRLDIDFGVVTARQALHRGRWDLCGAVMHDLHPTQSSAPHRKRGGPFWRVTPQQWEADGLLLRSSPLRNEDWAPSTPYDKHFGLELKADQEELPMLPEGEAAMLVAELLQIHDVHR